MQKRTANNISGGAELVLERKADDGLEAPAFFHHISFCDVEVGRHVVS